MLYNKGSVTSIIESKFISIKLIYMFHADMKHTGATRMI